MPITDPADDVCIDPVKVPLVQLGKTRRIALSGLDQHPFVLRLAHGLSIPSSVPQTKKLRSYFGFQFCSRVIGEAPTSSRRVLMRKRPSRDTSKLTPRFTSVPPPTMRVRNSAAG